MMERSRRGVQGCGGELGKGKVAHPLLLKELERNHNLKAKAGGHRTYQHGGRGAGGQGADEEIKGSWEDEVTTATRDTREQPLCCPGDARPFLQQTHGQPVPQRGLMEQGEEQILLLLPAARGQRWLLPGRHTLDSVEDVGCSCATRAWCHLQS